MFKKIRIRSSWFSPFIMLKNGGYTMNTKLFYKVCSEINSLEEKLILDDCNKIVKGNAINKEIQIKLKCWNKIKNYLYLY